MKPDGPCVSSLFMGSNRQHRPVCAKTISPWVRKVLCVAKAHMSLGSLWGLHFCGLSGWCFPECPSCRQVTGPKFLHQQDSIFPPTLLLQIGTRTLYSLLCWASVSKCSLGKCQTLTYIQSCIYCGVDPALHPSVGR